MLDPGSTPITDLARRLRKETRELHAEAEGSPLIRRLLDGRLACKDYCALLRNLHALYGALEPALARHAGKAVVANACDPALARAPSLVADLETLHGPDWAQAYPLQPACSRYVDRLHELDRKSPQLLLAHSYVRYLGDLSGGQLLGRIVGESLPPAKRHAIAFYQFGSPQETLLLAKSFREALAEMPSSGPDSDLIVDEACMAFAWHRNLFDEVAASATSIGTPAAGSVCLGR